jgi:iron complex transport system substrate-binding protein
VPARPGIATVGGGSGPVLRAVAALLLAGTVAARAEPPAHPTIASIDLCADQAVVVLAEPGTIAGLSRWARDANLSPVAPMAGNLPSLAESAESVLMSGASTVVADTYGDAKTFALLERIGVTVFRMPAADSFAEVFTALRSIARDLQEEAKERILEADLGARLDRLQASLPPQPPRAAYIRTDGGTAGDGTAVDAALAAAGYRNLATDLGVHGWGRLDLETLVMSPPDVFVTSSFSSRRWSLHDAFGRHPVFRDIEARVTTVAVPARLWSCGGWPLVQAAETLAAARREIR